jgi:GntR family transcriptional regulator, transcriptional repressor for pyruvate dehydrogenase complex
MDKIRKANSLLKPIKKIRHYESVVNQIMSLISKGKLKIGERLLTERQFAEELQVGRSSIREALRILEILGLIEIKHGDGAFVKAIDFSNILGSITENLSPIFSNDYDTLFDLLELREALEIEIVLLATLNSTEADIEKMKKQLEIMEETNDIKKFIKADYGFHKSLARATGNKIIESILENIKNVMNENYKIIYAYLNTDKNILKQVVKSHRDIFESIKSNNPKKAKEDMEEHMRQNKQNLIDALKMFRKKKNIEKQKASMLNVYQVYKQ